MEYRVEKTKKKMEYQLIPTNRYADVIEHLRNSFFADEPLNHSARLCQIGQGNKDLEEQCYLTLQDQMSFMAIENNMIAGVILNGILKPGDTLRAKMKLESSNDESYKSIFNLLYTENLKLNLFEYFNIEKIFDIRILSVDSKYRGQGIAKNLVITAEKYAQENGFEVMKADATGVFSQKILKSFGFAAISEIYYDQYVGADGLPIFQVASPHNKLELLYKQIANNQQNQV